MNYSYVLCFLGLIALARPAHAQQQKSLFFGEGAQPGTYTLVDDIRKVYQGALKVYAHELVAKDQTGHTTKYQPEEVYRVQLGNARYITASGFQTKSGFWSTTHSEKSFVELLDSGRVTLCRFRYSVGAPSYSSTNLVTYMLLDAATDSVTTIPVSVYTGKGKRFRDALAPFVAQRPDLQALLQAGTITIDQLPAFVHALNYQMPFTVAAGVTTKPFGVD
ncbi:MAG: hypothetical protein ACRYG7_04400 [Janthinobacterium lividum]|jgi:hypothetical protein